MKLSCEINLVLLVPLASGFASISRLSSVETGRLRTGVGSLSYVNSRTPTRLFGADANGSSAATPEQRLDESLNESSLSSAISILDQNPRLDLPRERWNGVFDAIERRTTEAEENVENKRLLEDQSQYQIDSVARTEMTEMYSTLKKLDHLRLFGAGAEFPPAAGSHVVTPTLLEEVTDLSMMALTPKPTNSLLFAGAAVAVAEGLASVALGVNVNFLVFATLVLALLDRIATNGAVLESFVKIFSPGVQNKIVRHEAGHFLTAYLLGLPVEGCVLSAWDALQDARFDKRAVSAGTSFFDPVLSDQINRSIVGRGSIDRYSIVVMAGIAAEAINFGRADGGAGDEMALVSFLSNLNGRPQQGRVPPWNNDSIRNQARWGALQSVMLLREYRPCYDALVDALERGGSLGECVYAIEEAGRDAGLAPLAKPLGFILDEGPYGIWTTDASKGDAAGGKFVVDAKPTSESPEDSLRALKDYREQVETRLKEIDDKLKQMDE